MELSIVYIVVLMHTRKSVITVITDLEFTNLTEGGIKNGTLST